MKNYFYFTNYYKEIKEVLEEALTRVHPEAIVEQLGEIQKEAIALLIKEMELRKQWEEVRKKNQTLGTTLKSED